MGGAFSSKLGQRLKEVSAEILEAQRPIRVLRSIAWPAEVEQAFFASGESQLPRPCYPISSDVLAALERLRAVQAQLSGENEIERFLSDTAGTMATAARMLLSVGTKDFYYHSVELYGRPAGLSSDRLTTNLELARHFDDIVSGFSIPPEEDDLETIPAEAAVPLLQARLDTFFEASRVRVTVVDGLVARAAASSEEIKLQREAVFSPRDLRQIECHEGQVHVATAQNGRAQPILVFLGIPTPRTTSTQEGLAVLNEFLTGATSLVRVRRMSDRMLAIKQAEDGADFIEVYRFFRGRGYAKGAAFDGARRVFRGGVIEGGAPLTKDVCYLDGLLRVTNFLRIALVSGRSELTRYLFAGKLAVEDVPLVARLCALGLAEPPRYVPAWARDLSYLTALMGYAAFLGESNLETERRRFEDAVGRVEEL